VNTLITQKKDLIYKISGMMWEKNGDRAACFKDALSINAALLGAQPYAVPQMGS
jgi:hypothetical protein